MAKKDVDTLFNHVEFSDNWKGKTNRLIFLIFYNTGMRLSELINLREKDIDFYNQSIKVLGKGNKERIIPMSNELSEAIKTYSQQKKGSAGQNGQWGTVIEWKGKETGTPNSLYNCENLPLHGYHFRKKESAHFEA